METYNAGRRPRASLVIPVYNVERYLEQCLESACRQTLRDIEVVCVNDGSTDGSLAIIERFAAHDPRIRVVNKPNSGYGASMNRGLSEARGEYVGILESDDFMEPDALEKLVDAAEELDADVAKGNFNLYWSAPAERIEFFELVRERDCGRPVDTRAETRIFHQKPSIWSAVYRRAFLDDPAGDGSIAPIRFLETPGAAYQDTSFAFKALALARRATFLHDSVLNYRQDNESSSVNSRGKAFFVCDEYAEIERFLAALPEGNPARALGNVELAAKYDSYMWNYARLAPELRLPFLRRMADEFGASMRRDASFYDELKPWKRANLRAILDSPERFERDNAAYADAGALGRAKHYLKLGGPALLASYAAARLRHE